jgi:hypothetical protein
MLRWDVGLSDLGSVSTFFERKEYPILLEPPNVLNSSINRRIPLWTLVGEAGLHLSNFLRISYFHC